MELEITDKIPFILIPPKIKCLCTNLTKYIQDLSEENCTTLAKRKQGRHPRCKVARIRVARDILHER